MKRAALKEKGRPAKRARPQNQLALTQTIVRRELRKKTDWKYTDNSAVVTNTSSTGAITSLLANLVRGDAGKDNFGGNEIYPQAVTVRYFWTSNQTYNAVRFMIFQWFDSSTPVVSGILESNATTTATLSPVLITNKRYIKVLYDETHVIAPTASGDTTVLGYGATSPAIKVYIPGKRLKPVRYNSSANTLQDGNIYCLAISDDSLASYPAVSWYSRVTFSDND